MLICEKVKGGEETFGNPARIKTGDAAATRSSEVLDCGPEGIRTPDLYSAIVALSQLSYRPG